MCKEEPSMGLPWEKFKRNRMRFTWGWGRRDSRERGRGMCVYVCVWVRKNWGSRSRGREIFVGYLWEANGEWSYVYILTTYFFQICFSLYLLFFLLSYLNIIYYLLFIFFNFNFNFLMFLYSSPSNKLNINQNSEPRNPDSNKCQEH